MTAFTKLSIRLVGILTFSAVSLANADDLTFYADALPVFQKNCVACHQDNGPDVGGIFAPMALDDYEQAKIWAPLIKTRSSPTICHPGVLTKAPRRIQRRKIHR